MQLLELVLLVKLYITCTIAALHRYFHSCTIALHFAIALACTQQHIQQPKMTLQLHDRTEAQPILRMRCTTDAAAPSASKL